MVAPIIATHYCYCLLTRFGFILLAVHGAAAVDGDAYWGPEGVAHPTRESVGPLAHPPSVLPPGP